MEAVRRTLRVLSALVGALLCACLALAGCGAGDGVTQAAPATHPPRTKPSSAGTGPTAGPPMPVEVPPRPGSIRDLKQRCFAETRKLQDAYLTYTSPFTVKQSDTERFTARLVQDADLAGAGRSSKQGHLAVACTVQARLVTDGEEVGNADKDWVTQRYLPPAETRWTWVVTGRKPGRSDAVVELKPVVRISESDGHVSEQPLGTQSFDVTFEVSRSAGSWLSSTGGTIVALASGLTVIAGAVVALRRLFMGKRSAAET